MRKPGRNQMRPNWCRALQAEQARFLLLELGRGEDPLVSQAGQLGQLVGERGRRGRSAFAATLPELA